ncbi:MAG TPA: hypothetical protein VI365_17770 [Trebonia sp.]
MGDFERLNKKARQEMGKVLDPSERVLIAYQGDSAALVATDRRIHIAKYGFQCGLAGKCRVSSWGLAEITEIEFHVAAMADGGMRSIIVHAPGLAPLTKFGLFGSGPESVWESPNALFVKKGELDGVLTTLRGLVADHQAAGA